MSLKNNVKRPTILTENILTSSNLSSHFQWTGQNRIQAPHGQLLYNVANLDPTKGQRVHATRILPYRTGIDGADVPGKIRDLFDRTIARQETINDWRISTKLPTGIP